MLRPPVLSESYGRFKKEVQLWVETTSVPVEKQAGTLLLSLPEKDREVAIEIPGETLKKGRTDRVGDVDVNVTGVQCLLEVLDEIYLENVAKETFVCYDKFRNLSIKPDQDVRSFILDFEKHMRRLEAHGMKLPEPVLAYELLRACNVDEHKYSVAISLVVDNLTYEKMKSVVKSLTQRNESAKSEKPEMKVVKELDFNTFYTEKKSEEKRDQECVCKDDGLTPCDGEMTSTYYANRGRGRGQKSFQMQSGYKPNRGRNYSSTSQNEVNSRRGNYGPKRGSQSKPTNPKDPNGNIRTCYVCGSIYHYANSCPDSAERNDNQTYFMKTESINLLQHVMVTEQSNHSKSMESFTKNNFGLAVLDSGCNVTVCGRQWLQAYLDSLDEKDMGKVHYEKSQVNFKFGDNPTTPSSEVCLFPATICGKGVTIRAQVVNDNIPLLISKHSMKKAKMILDFNNDSVTAYGVTRKLVFTESGHCSIPLNEQNLVHKDVCLCSTENIVLATSIHDSDTKSVAEKLHRQFAHPPAESLKNLIRSAKKLTKDLSTAIDDVSSSCEICRRYKQPPNRPVVSMPIAKDFNDTVAMDIKIFDQKRNIYFQHMIDHRTRFSNVALIRSKDKETVVQSVFTHWIQMFGPPKKFLTDNGGEYVNSSFMDLCDKFNVHVMTTGAEAPWSNGLVERHHALLARNVSKILEETQCSVETALAWACHAKNSMSDVNGFSPYQLLLGTNPVLQSLNDPASSPTTYEMESPSMTVATNIKAMYSARKQQITQETDAKIKRALKHNIRECYKESIVTGDLVYYKRDNDKRWRGPATVIGTDGKLVFIRHGGYVVRCHRTAVIKVNDLYEPDQSEPDPSEKQPQGHKKLEECHFAKARQFMVHDVAETHYPDKLSEDVAEAESTNDAEDINESTKISTKDSKLCDYKVAHEKKKLVVALSDSDPFKLEKKAEIDKWIENDVYEEVSVNDLTEEDYPISTRWITEDTTRKKKARLVARGYEAPPMEKSSTFSPTCRKESLRILFSLAATNHWKMKSIDISSAFLQGISLDRNVYLIPPKEFAKPGIVWKLKKCVYGLYDAARMWYNTVKEKVEKCGLQRCPYDDAMFYAVDSAQNLQGVITVHVDDFIYAGKQTFHQVISEELMSGLQIKSQEAQAFTYLGLEISQSPDTHCVSVLQDKYIQELSVIAVTNQRKSQKSHALSPVEYKKLRSGVGQINWLAIQTRPDIAFHSCQLSNNLKNPNVSDLTSYNKLIKKLKSDDPLPLTFKPIPTPELGLKLAVYSDAAYNNLANSGSQAGYLILLSDMDETILNPVAWKSVRIDRVCRSTLAAESLALSAAADHVLFIKENLKKLVGNITPISIDCYIDSKGLKELLEKTKDPSEKRLIVTMAELREMVENEEINVHLIPSKKMPADVLTKRGVDCNILREFLTSNNHI